MSPVRIERSTRQEKKKKKEKKKEQRSPASVKVISPTFATIS
mgnify:CR=1 FL=1